MWAVGKDVTASRSATRSSCTAACGIPTIRTSLAGKDPMLAPSQKIWGYESNWGSFAQYTKVQDHQCVPKPARLTWEEAAAYMLVGATAYRMLHGWQPNVVTAGDPVLIWGGAGGLGSMAIQIARAAGARPVAVVSGDSKNEFCAKLGAVGVIDRRKFDHWGKLPRWSDELEYGVWLKGARAFGAAFWQALGDEAEPGDRVRASRRDHAADVVLHVRDRRDGRDLRGHERLQRDARPALSLDAAEATAGQSLRERRAGARASTRSSIRASSTRACRARSRGTRPRRAIS